MYEFRWNAWNLDHATRHGVSAEESQRVVSAARTPYPEHVGEGKFRVMGRARGNRLVQVVYLLDDDGTVYIIHARQLTDSEKRRLRKRLK